MERVDEWENKEREDGYLQEDMRLFIVGITKYIADLIFVDKNLNFCPIIYLFSSSFLDF